MSRRLKQRFCSSHPLSRDWLLTGATVLTRGRDIHHIKIAIDPHVVAPFEARPVGLLPDESGSQPSELASPVLIVEVL